MSDDENLSIYDEIEIEDMTYDETLQMYHYPCPCGDRFQIQLDDLRDEQDIAVCPSCSLMIRVIFDLVGHITDLLLLELFTDLFRMTFHSRLPVTQAPRSQLPPKPDTTSVKFTFTHALLEARRETRVSRFNHAEPICGRNTHEPNTASALNHATSEA